MSEPTEPKKYAMTMQLHLKLANGGYSYHYELVDYPGIYVHRLKMDRNSKVEQAIIFENVEYTKPSHAVAAWELKKGSNANTTGK